MNAQEATQKFQQAEQLYAQRQYDHALHVLMELNQAFPNNQKILYPLALCLAAVGRHEEAAQACDILIGQFQDQRAQNLRAQLELPPSVEDIDISLDMDVLGDLGKRPPKIKSNAPVAKSSWPMYAAIAAVVVVGVAGAYMSGVGAKLLDVVKPETAEATIAKIIDSAKGINSCAAGFDISGDVPSPMGKMQVKCNGSFEFLHQDQKAMFRLEASVDAMVQQAAFKVFSDGKTMFVEVNATGQQMVLKQEIPEGASQNAELPVNPADLMKDIQKFGAVALKGSDVVNGRLAYNFEITPKKDAMPAVPMPGMPQLGVIKLAVAKDNGLPIKFEVMDKDNKPFVTGSLKDIIVNAGVTPDRFAYTPPQGVPVMDFAAVQGMLGAMGGGMQMPGMK